MENPRKRQEKKLIVGEIIAFIIIVIIIFSTKGCNYFVNYQDANAKADLKQPHIITESSCWWGEKGGEFVVTSKYGSLCKGNSYSLSSNAKDNPLVIKSNGNIINVAQKGISLTGRVVEEKICKFKPGDRKMIRCRRGGTSSYAWIYIEVY